MKDILEELTRYTTDRDWDQFHSPKNLSMALSVEASELLELFQWKTEEASLAPTDKEKQAIADELADVFTYTLLLSKKLNIDLLEATRNKIEKNKQKYPADLVRGSAKKYTEY